MSTGVKWIAVAAIASASMAASAYTSVGMRIAVPVYVAPPPSVAVASVQVARAWEPGHWEWQGDGHVWVPGRYAVPHRRYALRDSDRDGVPDRFDRAPFNPYRY